MKVFIALMVLMVMTVSHAEEIVQTDCPAINNSSNESEITTISSSVTRTGSTAQ